MLMKIRLREPTMAWLFLIPAFVGVVLFLYYPLVQTMIYSFFDLHRTVDWLHQPFVGLDNYYLVVTSSSFRSSFSFTLYFTVVSVSVELCLGLGMAIATFWVPRRLAGILRAALVTPWAIPPMVSAMLWKWLFHGDAGLFGYLLTASGLLSEPPPFLTDPAWAKHSVILAEVWKNSSIVAIILLAGLAGIPQDIYDAAKIDGARAWFRFRRVTLPMLLPSILVATLFRVIEGLRMFDLVFGLTGGGPGKATDTLSTFAYKFYFTYSRFGLGSSYAMVIFALIIAFIVVYVNRIRRNLRFKG